ncbi:hypothetical protein RUND412_008793 [Rhizina undulata]
MSATSTQPQKAPSKGRRKGKKSVTEAAAAGEIMTAPLSLAPEGSEARLSEGVNGNATTNGYDASKGEKEYIKEVSKRLKKQVKKMENIKRSEDKIKDLPEEEKATTIKINFDERKKMADKPIVAAVLKELQEIHDNLKSVSEAEDKRLIREKSEAAAKLETAVAEAREEGRKEGAAEANDKLLSVVRFLRLAGYRRRAPGESAEENEAVERVLVQVYAGDNNAVEACLKLANGTDDNIEEFQVTYGRIKEVAYELKLGAEDESETAETAPEAEAEPEAELSFVPETSEALTADVQASAEIDSAAPEFTVPQFTVPLESDTESEVPPQQTLTNGDHTEPIATIPSASVTAKEATNEVAQVRTAAEPVVEQQPVPEPSVEAQVEPQAVAAAQEPVPQDYTPATSANDETEGVPLTEEPIKKPESKDGEFQHVEPRRGGRGGRGGYRGRDGGFRGAYRGNGEYRGRGHFRGDRGGEHRGRGGYRGRGGDRGEGYRPRGGNEGEGYRPRGGNEGEGHRPRGDRYHHHSQSQQPQPQQQHQVASS